jgi:hypothetical protein
MDRIDITLKREGASAITLTFAENEPDAARERLDFLTFILRPFTGAEGKRVAEKPASKPTPPRTSPTPSGEQK